MGPSEIVEGVKLSIDNWQSLEELILVGDENILNPLLKTAKLRNNPKIRVLHASEVIGMDEKPIQSLKKKKDSSMVRALELVKDGEASGILSCGNTGSLMAGGTIKIRPLEGVDRPALAAVMPGRDGHFVLVDVGANPTSEPLNIVHNAVLGSNYARVTLGIEKPRVGLLTIGIEEGKGNEVVNESHKLLKGLQGTIQYEGLIEGFQLFDNAVDVIVCDGFVGNVLLKSSEGLFNMIKDLLKEEMMQGMVRKVGAVMTKGAFTSMKSKLSPERFGGAPLLGLKGHVFKAHGSSNRHSIASGIRVALDLIHCEMLEQVKLDIKSVNEIIKN